MRKYIRKIVQFSFLFLFLFLIFNTKYPPRLGRFPLSLYLIIDPLTSILTMLSSRSITSKLLIPLILLVLSLFWRRFFCRWVCPLGTSIGLINGISQRKKWKFKGKQFPQLKFYLLLFLFFLSLFSLPLVWTLDPLIIATRSLSFPGVTLAISLGGAILLLSLLFPFFWCRSLCPLGALWELIPHLLPPRKKLPFDPSRRYFLGTILASFLAFTLLGWRRPLKDERFLRPPGSSPEERFPDLCIRCGQCIKVCPTRGLKPVMLEEGVERFWTPRLVPRLGGCELCMLCGRVCPTPALHPIARKQVKIGTSELNRERCLVWKWKKDCLVCYEYCPVGAIMLDGENRPYVLEEKCIGCGLCERECPVEGEAAIIVTNKGEKRIRDLFLAKIGHKI